MDDDDARSLIFGAHKPQQIEHWSALSILFNTDKNIRHHSGQNVLAVMTDCLCQLEYGQRCTTFDLFLQYSTSKKMFTSERDQDRDTKKDLALSITFSQSNWLLDTLTRLLSTTAN